MKKYLQIIAVVTLIFAGFSCNNNAKTETTTATKKVYYTCPMHPEVKSDKPGKCPQCGDMDLEKKEE